MAANSLKFPNGSVIIIGSPTTDKYKWVKRMMVTDFSEIERRLLEAYGSHAGATKLFPFRRHPDYGYSYTRSAPDKRKVIKYKCRSCNRQFQLKHETTSFCIHCDSKKVHEVK